MSFHRSPDITTTHSDQPVTGFTPSDFNMVAPNYLVDPVATFAPPAYTGEVIEVDPLGALTEKELHEDDEMLRGVMQSMKDAYIQLGVPSSYRR